MAKYLLSNLQKNSSNMESSDKKIHKYNNYVNLEHPSSEIIENGKQNDKVAVFYGVHIPPETQQMQDKDGVSQVYQDRVEAMKAVRKYKKARFKAFNYFQDAMDFAIHGSEHVYLTPVKSNGYCHGYSNGAVPIVIKENTQSVGEKPAPFRGPKSQDLVKFRKAIECGNIELVRTTVWDNPRYLISSGDTPSILQEGSRYNALHVAAKAKNRKMCEVILSTISNNQFIRLLYGEDSYQDTDARANMLVDLYLNTPDKGTHETPLHFAVKFGAADVVELLVSFPQCDKTLKNKFGYSLNMLICDRCDKNTPNLEATKKRIEMLLKETYYVPVLRSRDNCMAPIIGAPFAPNSPPNINTNPLMPQLEIKAYAGPMDKEGAEKFRRVWKTPPRTLVFNSPSKHTNLNRSLVEVSPLAVKVKDVDKGVERVGRALASQFDVDWKEEWKFLGWFGDLSTNEGLDKLEKFLAERESSEMNMSSSGSSLLEGDILEISARNKITAESPITDLCKNFAAINLSSDSSTPIKACQSLTQIKKSTTSTADTLNSMEMLKSDLHPLFYLEKSCQVFAHRFTNAILNLDSDYDNPTLSLESHLKPLQQLISSFISDARFAQIDFRLVHSRLGTLIGNKLKDSLMQESDYEFMRKTMEKLSETCSKRFDCFSSDDESCYNRQVSFLQSKNLTSKNKQILCLLENILSDFTFNDSPNHPVKNEEECILAWDKAKPCACIWRAESNRRSSLNKKGSRYLFRSSSLSKDDYISRQLNFGSEDGVTENAPCDCDKIAANTETNQSASDDDDEEAFYTPPSSPVRFEDELISENDVFEDSIYPEMTIFIEGNHPTKTDYDVYNSVNLAEDRLDPKQYPNIYKWHHAVNLYTEEERNCWSSVTCGSMSNSCSQINDIATSSPVRVNRSYPRSSLSFNL